MRYARQNALLHMQRMEALRHRELEEQLYLSASPREVNGSSDPEVVMMDELLPFLKRWREAYEKENDILYRMGEILGKDVVTGPITFLSEHTGIPLRRIGDLMNGKTKFISRNRAEALLIAINMEHIIATGEIHVVPNPMWSMKRWLEFMVNSACIDL